MRFPLIGLTFVRLGKSKLMNSIKHPLSDIVRKNYFGSTCELTEIDPYIFRFKNAQQFGCSTNCDRPLGL